MASPTIQSDSGSDAQVGFDDQDRSETFDEDNTNLEEDRVFGEDRETLEELPDVYDATAAVGDDDDEAAEIGEDMDDDEIVAAELDQDAEDEDLEEDALFARDPDSFEPETDVVASDDTEDADVVDGVDAKDPDEVELVYAGDLNDAPGGGSAARHFESKTLSDSDLEDLDYKEPRS